VSTLFWSLRLWYCRGVEGRIAACALPVKDKIPYLGIWLGMQVAVIE